MGEGKLTPLTTPTLPNRQSRNIAHMITSTVHHICSHATFGQDRPAWATSPHIAKVTTQFLSRVSTLTRDIDIAILSVSPSIRLSVRNAPVSDKNGLTYCHSFFYHMVAQSF